MSNITEQLCSLDDFICIPLFDFGSGFILGICVFWIWKLAFGKQRLHTLPTDKNTAFGKQGLLLSVEKIMKKLDTLPIDVKTEIFAYNYNAGDNEWKAFKDLIPTIVTSTENATCMMILIQFDQTRITNCVNTCILGMLEDGIFRADLKKIVIIYDEDSPGMLNDDRIADLWHVSI